MEHNYIGIETKLEQHSNDFFTNIENYAQVQDDETTSQHLVLCIMLVDTKVQNKTSVWLLNVILDSGGTATMIN